jgi:hypothetical protein
MTAEGEVTDARLWHPWLRIQRLLRDIAGGSTWEPTPWRAVQRAAWRLMQLDVASSDLVS